MTTIKINRQRKKTGLTSEQNLPADAAARDHDILIECTTPGVEFTVTRRKRAGTVFAAFPENVIRSNESATFRLPATEELKITPSDNGAQYTVIWDSF